MKYIFNRDIESWCENVCREILNSANRAKQRKSEFNIVLPGGETPSLIFKHLRQICFSIINWNIFLSDERIPTPEYTNLNSQAIELYFLDLLAENSKVYFIPTGHGIYEGVKQYNDILDKFNLTFDLTLLGIGEDGHTASLFPGNELGTAKDSPDVLAVLNSPKPPSNRITLSANRLSNSTDVLFIARGINKKNIINQILSGSNLPANLIRGKNQTSLFYCEE